ncbi:MAG: glycosyltransferase [Microcoleaceae cyanobacterium]
MYLNQAHSLLVEPSGLLRVLPQGAIEPSMIELSLIIPTYQESDNITQLIQRLTQLLDPILPARYELIIIDDDSPDHTWQVALNLSRRYPQLQVMRRRTQRGLSTAVIRGWQVARGSILGVIDADLQHPPETLIELLANINAGADLAVGSRHVHQGGVSDWSLTRRFLSRGAQVLGLILLPGILGRVSDPMSGYFMVRRDTIAGRTLSPKGYKILIEVLGRGNIGFIAEVGYIFQERTEGASKVTWKQYIEYLQHLLQLRLALFPVRRFLQFGMVGFSGVFIDLGIFYLLREQIALGLTRSAILSTEVAIFNNFLWNDLWTFRDISQKQRGWLRRLQRFLKFNGVCLVGLILNVLLVNILFNLLGINEYLAKLMAIAVVTVWNFWINLKLSWRVTDMGSQRR